MTTLELDKGWDLLLHSEPHRRLVEMTLALNGAELPPSPLLVLAMRVGFGIGAVYGRHDRLPTVPEEI